MATKQIPDPEGQPSNQKVKQPKEGQNTIGKSSDIGPRKQGRQPMMLDDEHERDRKDSN